MNKAKFFDKLIQALRDEAFHAIKASQDAADYATNGEARPESKWDTQGLEASYLAAGQAGQAQRWADAVEEMQGDREDLLQPKTKVELGALFTCEMGGVTETFFFCHIAGGQVIEIDGKAVTVITGHSPLAGHLLGLKAGEAFTLPDGKSGSVLAVE